MFSAEAGQQAMAIGQTVWMWSTAAAFALFLVATFILWGFRSRMPVSRFLFWIAVIVVLPIAGPIIWFALGRRRYPPRVEESFTTPPTAPKLD